MKTAQEMLDEIMQLFGNHKLERECPSCGEVQQLFIDQMGFKCDHCGYHEERTNPWISDRGKVTKMIEDYVILCTASNSQPSIANFSLP